VEEGSYDIDLRGSLHSMLLRGKVSTVIRLHYVLVEARRALRTKLVTDVYVLRGGSLSSLERRGAVQHRVRSARTAVEFTWLGYTKTSSVALTGGRAPLFWTMERPGWS
jgi:hypothetical protein